MSIQIILNKENNVFSLILRMEKLKIKLKLEDLLKIYKKTIEFNEKNVLQDDESFKLKQGFFKRLKIILHKYKENSHWVCDITFGQITITYAYLCYLMESEIKDFDEDGDTNRILKYGVS